MFFFGTDCTTILQLSWYLIEEGFKLMAEAGHRAPPPSTSSFCLEGRTVWYPAVVVFTSSAYVLQSPVASLLEMRLLLDANRAGGRAGGGRGREEATLK